MSRVVLDCHYVRVRVYGVRSYINLGPQKFGASFRVLKKLFDPIIIAKCNQIGIWHGHFGMDNCMFECKQVAFTIWYVFAL